MVWDHVGIGPVEGGDGIAIEDSGVEGKWNNGEALVIHDLKVHHLGQYRCHLPPAHLNQGKGYVKPIDVHTKGSHHKKNTLFFGNFSQHGGRGHHNSQNFCKITK